MTNNSDAAKHSAQRRISELPCAEPKRNTTKKTNTSAGKNAYAACIACHAESGEGDPALDAPSLRQLEDWYIVRQLQAFHSGQRGKHAADVLGQQMRPFAANLSDQEIGDIAAYPSSLE